GGAANAVTLSSTVYDAQGNAVPVTYTFTKTAANTWTVVPTTPAPNTVLGSSTITFNGSGKIATGGTGTLTVTETNGATFPGPISVDFSQITQLASTPSDLSSNTDGASAGTLTSFTVGQAGD